jgi:hypothetical protein
MNLGQVLLLALAAPATYLLLYVLLRLENLLPDPAPPAGHEVAAAARGRHAGAGPGPQPGTPVLAPRLGWSTPRPLIVTTPAAVGSGAGEGPTWTIPLPVPAATGAPSRGLR